MLVARSATCSLWPTVERPNLVGVLVTVLSGHALNRLMNGPFQCVEVAKPVHDHSS